MSPGVLLAQSMEIFHLDISSCFHAILIQFVVHILVFQVLMDPQLGGVNHSYASNQCILLPMRMQDRMATLLYIRFLVALQPLHRPLREVSFSTEKTFWKNISNVGTLNQRRMFSYGLLLVPLKSELAGYKTRLRRIPYHQSQL